MAMLTIRNLDESVKSMLRVQAAQHGWAMEEEVRRILTQATQGQLPELKLGSRIHERFKSIGRVDLPARQKTRPAPTF
jgi:plasmid stability protein